MTKDTITLYWPYRIKWFLSNLYDKITLRKHYRDLYFDMMMDFIESKYSPEVISGKSVKFTGKKIVFKGHTIFFTKTIEFKSSEITMYGNMSLVRKPKMKFTTK